MDAFPPAERIPGALLEFLADELGPCRYVEPPARMTPGNDTQVWSFRVDRLEHPLVLRLFRTGSDPGRALFEGTLQSALADQGLPVPRTRAICTDRSVLGEAFFVMDRVAGEPLYGDSIGTDEAGVPQARLWQLVAQADAMLLDMPRTLAETTLRVHAVAAKPVAQALDAAGVDSRELTIDGRIGQIARRIEEHRLVALAPGEAWLREHRPAVAASDAQVVCHCDMQPLNLIFEGRELRGILDWSNACLAPPELDIGWTRAMYLTLPLPLPGALRLLDRPIAWTLAGRFTRVYQRRRPVDRGVLGYYEAFRSLLGLSILGEDVVRGVPIRDAWNSRKAVAQVCAHVKRHTGVAVSIPWYE